MQEDKADGDKWDYVLVFVKNPHPKDRNGNLLSEESSATKKWREIKRRRKELTIHLQKPQLGLIFKK
jgi:hypothetical protein